MFLFDKYLLMQIYCDGQMHIIYKLKIFWKMFNDRSYNLFCFSYHFYYLLVNIGSRIKAKVIAKVARSNA